MRTMGEQTTIGFVNETRARRNITSIVNGFVTRDRTGGTEPESAATAAATDGSMTGVGTYEKYGIYGGDEDKSIYMSLSPELPATFTKYCCDGDTTITE